MFYLVLSVFGALCLFFPFDSLDGKPWMPTVNSKICSYHFIGNEKSNNPLNPSYNPTIYETLAHNDLESNKKVERFDR